MIQLTSHPDNLGGLHLLLAVPPAQCTIAPDYATGLRTLTIADATGAILIPVLADGTYAFAEEHGRDAHGDYWKPSLTGTIPRHDPTSGAVIETLERGEWVVVMEDANGVTRLCGDPSTPMQFATQATTGAASSDVNGTPFTLSATLGHPSWYTDFDLSAL